VIPAKWLAIHSNSEITFLGTLGPYLSSMFLHGGWFHLIGNMLYLWIFGDNIEDRLGHFKFLFFYLLCGVVAGFSHTLFNLKSFLPCVGASGAIAGVLGAYMILYPRAKVLTLFPILFFWQIVEIPAAFFLGLWLVMQFLTGLTSITVTAGTGGIAWMAHVGGFISGIYFIKKMEYNRYRNETDTNVFSF
jgi:membrane associated rhomboid family serine protease